MQAKEADRIMHSEKMSKNKILGNITIYGSHADGRAGSKKRLR